MDSAPDGLCTLFVSVAVAVGACTAPQTPGTSGGIEPTGHIELTEEVTIGESSGVHFGHVVDISVDSKGRIYACDTQLQTVWVFSPQGDSLTTIGRAGRGPGEFLRMIDIEIGRKDSLFAFDWRAGRITAFSPAPRNAYVYTAQIPEARVGYRSGFMKPDTSGFLVTYQLRPDVAENVGRRAVRWLRWTDHQGTIRRDSLLVVPDREWASGQNMSLPRPFGRQPVIRVGPENSVYYAWTDSLSVGRYDLKGQLLNRVRVKSRRSVVDESHLQTYIDRLEARWSGFSDGDRRLLEKADLPKTFPALDGFVVDDQHRLWIRRGGAPDERAPGIVVDPTSEEATRFMVPRDVQLMVVNGGRVYGLRELATGLQGVVVYRFQQPLL